MLSVAHASSIRWASSLACEGIARAELWTGNQALLAPSSSVAGTSWQCSLIPRWGWRPRQRGGRNAAASSPNACDSRRRRPHSSHWSWTSPARPLEPSSISFSVPLQGRLPCRNSTHGKSSRWPFWQAIM